MVLNHSLSAAGTINWEHTLSHLSDAIALFDAQLRCRFVNGVMAEWLQAPAADLLHRSCADWVEHQHVPTASRDLATTLHQQLQDCQQQASDRPLTLHWSAAETGPAYEFCFSLVPDETGAIAEIVCLGRGQPHPHPTSASGVQPLIGAEMPGLYAEESTATIYGDLPELDLPQNTAAVPLVQSESPDLVVPHLARHPLPDDAVLSKSKEVLRLVLDNIPQYIFWKDRNFRYLGCNQRWAEMAGLASPMDVVGLTDADLPWTEEQREWYLSCDRQVMETDTPMLQIRQSQLQADGQFTWREVNKLPLHDEAGQVIGLLGTIEDVTERRRTEDLLQASEARYRRIAEQERIINQVASQIRRSLDLQTILQTVVAEVRRILNTDRVVVYHFNADWRGSVVTEDVGEQWISVLGDMGADDCFPSQFAELYSEGRIRAINDLNDPALDQCHVQFLRDIQVQANLIVPIISQDRLWGLLIAHACAAPRQWQSEEIELLRYLAGQLGIAIRQAELYQSAQDNATTAAAQAQKLATAMQELQKTQSQLIQTEKMSSLGQLVAGVAHEINNPVNFIYGNVSYIQSYIDDLLGLLELYQRHYPQPVPEVAEEIEAIDLDFILQDLGQILRSVRVGAERIREIVLSLRSFSRLDEAEMKRVDIHEGIDSTLLILHHRLKDVTHQAGIQIHKHYGELPPVSCYPSQLNQVFMNILNNAIDVLDEDHFPPGRSPEIQISTAYYADQNKVQIRIRDNGKGIPADVQKHLFDPFFTTKPVGKGTGLGLSISYQIVVERHHGSLQCQSEVGHGTEFIIDIPQKCNCDAD